MNEFRRSIATALRSAELATQYREEINAVIDRVSSAVSEETAGRLVVEMKRVPANALLAAAMLSVLDSKPLKYVYSVRLVQTNEPHQEHEIASIDMPPSVYPCEITTTARKEYCNDTKSLVALFQSILARAEVGKAIHRLSNAPDPETAQESGV